MTLIWHVDTALCSYIIYCVGIGIYRWTIINSGIGNKISGESPCCLNWDQEFDINIHTYIHMYIRTFSDMSVYMNHIRYPSWPTCTCIMQGTVSVHSASVWALLQVQECTHDQPVIACIPPSKSNYYQNTMILLLAIDAFTSLYIPLLCCCHEL